jgi:cytochrome c biogenesis protein CcdA
LGLAIAALVTGFLVSALEAVCVAKIYLPTIIFVLKTTNMKLKALFYLLLYNLLFVLPLFVIFIFALAGTSSEKFAAILKGHLGTVKILMGLMFLCLGVFLILRA